MKKISLLVFAVFLLSCSMQPTKGAERLIETVSYYGARNDLRAVANLSAGYSSSDFLEAGKVRVIDFPLDYAVVCNPERSACKHAVVKSEIEFSVQVVGDKFIKVSGVLRSEMGRSLSIAFPNNSIGAPQEMLYTQKMSLSVPDGVPVIGEVKKDFPFEGVISVGGKLEVKGLGGAIVAIAF